MLEDNFFKDFRQDRRQRYPSVAFSQSGILLGLKNRSDIGQIKGSGQFPGAKGAFEQFSDRASQAIICSFQQPRIDVIRTTSLASIKVGQ